MFTLFSKFYRDYVYSRGYVYSRLEKKKSRFRLDCFLMATNRLESRNTSLNLLDAFSDHGEHTIHILYIQSKYSLNLCQLFYQPLKRLFICNVNTKMQKREANLLFLVADSPIIVSYSNSNDGQKNATLPFLFKIFSHSHQIQLKGKIESKRKMNLQLKCILSATVE